MSHNTLPASVPRRLLAILINHPGQLAAHRAQLDQIRFADPRDQALYAGLKATVEGASDAASVDVADVLHHLEAAGKLPHAGGRDHILGLLSEPGTVATQPLPRLVELVAGDYARRAAVEGITRIVKAAEGGADPATLGAMVNERIAPLRLLGAPKFELLGSQTDDLIAHFENPAREPALPTGIPALDELIGGLYPTNLITIAAPTGMGKSSLAGQIALAGAHIAKNNPGRFGAPDGKVAPVLVFSFEMPAREFHTRFVAQVSPVTHGYHLRRGWLSDDKPIAIAGAKKIADLPIYVFDITTPTAEAVRGEVEAFIQHHGTKPSVVLVDHMGLMKAARLTNPTEIMSHVSGALKTMAQQLDIPVVAVGQLSRESVKREDKRPQLFDLKQSGDVENNSNVVILLHRDSYHLDKDERKRVEERGCPAEIIVAKNRSGQVGTVKTAWLGFRQLHVPDPSWVSTYGSIDADVLAGGIIEYPTLDPSAFAIDGSTPPSQPKTNGTAGRPIDASVLSEFVASQRDGVTVSDVSKHFDASPDTAKKTLDVAVAETRLEKQDLGPNRSPRYLYHAPGYADRAWEEANANVHF